MKHVQRLTGREAQVRMRGDGQIFSVSIMPYSRARRIPLWASTSAAALFVVLLVFLNVGRWLVREDPLQKATAIAVLSGRMPERALEAVRIYKHGYASRVWLTHSTEPGATLAQLSVHYLGEEEYNKQLLMRGGIPESAIEILDPPIENTADEMRTIGAALEKKDHGTVILVTSKVHTRRVRALWNRLAKSDGIAVVRGVSDDGFDAAHWWKDTQDALDVVREVLGLMNAWAGLPLGHSRN
jgi:uncharacterized SAM-binding protein YcdF (DUF218 family)